MNTPPDFSKYAKQLNIEQLKKQGTQALADELSYTRQLYESLDTIFQDSLDGFFITDGEGNVLKVVGDKVIVDGVNIVTKHIKPKYNNGEGEIVKTEAPIHRSNVKVIESVDKVKKSEKKADSKKEESK